MSPDPREWEYTGRVNDTGVLGGSECACGQEIRYEFILERARDGKQLVIGSHCIETSVPYLIEHGAEGLATNLQRAQRAHALELARARRAAKAAATLPSARAELERLIEWFATEEKRFEAAAAANDHFVISMPYDLSARPTQPADDAQPGRALGVIRRGYPNAWLRALRYAHEHAADLPPLPDDPDLRERVGRAVRAQLGDSRSELAPACAFARLAYRGDPRARRKIPASASTTIRRGHTLPMPSPGGPDAELSAEPVERQELLRRALEQPQDPETERRLKVFDEAMRRRRSAS